MNLERYQLETDDNSEIFEFISLGYKGKILKRIKYIQTEDPKLWNLSMGDVNKETDEVDYFQKRTMATQKKYLQQ